MAECLLVGHDTGVIDTDKKIGHFFQKLDTMWPSSS